MSIPLFFAISGEDIPNVPTPPPPIAWMACHFSPYGAGLTDLPTRLPAGSILILDDRIPMTHHDPDLILRQLNAAVEELGCSRLLLELLRASDRVPVERIVKEISCPVGVTAAYAKGQDCAVFLPPVPPHIPLPEYIAPWKERRIWLEVAPDGTDITITPQGSSAIPVPFPQNVTPSHKEETLCCHYTISTQPEQARFSLFRSLDDIGSLLQQAEQTNIELAIGLFQELSPLQHWNDK